LGLSAKNNTLALLVKGATAGLNTMNATPHDPENTELAPGFTVRDYKKARDSQPADRDAIAGAIHGRFTDRYIKPVGAEPRRGFTIMAVSCLMIEALESFRQGWETSDGKSKSAFCFFFDALPQFKDFRGHAQAFYTHVRCGILHQAETTGGWRIRRDGALFDATALTVNANCFLDALEQALGGFCDGLKTAAWDDPEWKRVRDKMNAIVRHCGPLQLPSQRPGTEHSEEHEQPRT
jgi:hypothetical protein